MYGVWENPLYPREGSPSATRRAARRSKAGFLRLAFTLHNRICRLYRLPCSTLILVIRMGRRHRHNHFHSLDSLGHCRPLHLRFKGFPWTYETPLGPWGAQANGCVLPLSPCKSMSISSIPFPVRTLTSSSACAVPMPSALRHLYSSNTLLPPSSADAMEFYHQFCSRYHIGRGHSRIFGDRPTQWQFSQATGGVFYWPSRSRCVLSVVSCRQLVCSPRLLLSFVMLI